MRDIQGVVSSEMDGDWERAGRRYPLHWVQYKHHSLVLGAGLLWEQWTCLICDATSPSCVFVECMHARLWYPEGKSNHLLKIKNNKYRIRLLWKVFPSWSSNLNAPGFRKMMMSCQPASYCSLDRKGRGRSYLRITSLQSSCNSADKSWVREDVQTAL